MGADCAPTILLMAAPAFVVFDMDDVLARRDVDATVRSLAAASGL